MIRRAALVLIMIYALFVFESAICLAEEIPNMGVNSTSEKSSKEHLTMEGVEIQGTIEKPHAVYVIPWGDIQDAVPGIKPSIRSFREEIVKPVDREQFQRQYSRTPTSFKGGSK